MNPLTNVRNIQNLNKRELERGVTFEHSWHQQYKDSAWIFIGGLDYDLTEGDIICLFSQYGEVANINLVRDKKTGKSKGFAFLCYENQLSTVLSVDNLNSIKLCGRTIRVDHVEEYRVPKMREDMTPEQQKLALEGCAPGFIRPPTPEKNIQESVKPDSSNSHKKHKRKDRSSSPANGGEKSSGNHKKHRDRSPPPNHKETIKEEIMSPNTGEQSSTAGCMVDGVLLPPRLFGAPLSKGMTAADKHDDTKVNKSKKNKKEKKDDKKKKKKEKKNQKKKKKLKHDYSESSSSSSSSDDESPNRRTSSSVREKRSSSPSKDAQGPPANDASFCRVKSEPRSDEDSDAGVNASRVSSVSAMRESSRHRSHREDRGHFDGRERNRRDDRDSPSSSSAMYRNRRDGREYQDRYERFDRERRDRFEDDYDRRRKDQDGRGQSEHNQKRRRSEQYESRDSRFRR